MSAPVLRLLLAAAVCACVCAQLNDAAVSYSKTKEGEELKSKPCDPSDLRACDAYRSPHEWGCCMAPKWPIRRYYSWLKHGCYCDSVQKRCIVERRLKDRLQWTYCRPIEGFDCYWNWTIKGRSCSGLGY